MFHRISIVINSELKKNNNTIFTQIAITKLHPEFKAETYPGLANRYSSFEKLGKTLTSERLRTRPTVVFWVVVLQQYLLQNKETKLELGCWCQTNERYRFKNTVKEG